MLPEGGTDDLSSTEGRGMLIILLSIKQVQRRYI
jgi:hypothetical protein